jgi:hypothetical protein
MVGGVATLKVTNAGDEGSVILLSDGSLMVVHRRNFAFQGGAPCSSTTDATLPKRGGSRNAEPAFNPYSCAYKQVFSTDDGLTWGPETVMQAKDGRVPPHSVMCGALFLICRFGSLERQLSLRMAMDRMDRTFVGLKPTHVQLNTIPSPCCALSSFSGCLMCCKHTEGQR